MTKETSGQYVTVPVEPTIEMLTAMGEANSAFQGQRVASWDAIYRAAIKAAPHTDALAYADAKVKEAVEMEREAFLSFLNGHERMTDKEVLDWLWTVRARGET